MENDNPIFQNPVSQSGQSPENVQIPPADFLIPPQRPLEQNFSTLATPSQQQASGQPVMQNISNDKPRSSGFPSGIKKLFSILASVFIILGLIVVAVIFIFPGFNKSSSLNKVTVTYWGLFEDNSVMESIISDFEKQNPNIKIEYIKQDPNQYKDRLTTRIANGTGPDIFRYHNTWVPMLKNYLLPLPNETISQEVFNTIFYPVMQKDLVKNGAIYGIPLGVDTLALFINTQLFQAAGVTAPNNWNDFVKVARAITVRDTEGKIKTAGAAMGTYSNITHAPDIMSLLFLENGVDFNNLSASTDRITEALTFYTSFANGDGIVWDNTLDPSQLAFAKGNLGMFFGYTSDYFAIKQFNPSLSFQIVPVPQLSGQNITLASYWVEGASVKGKHQKESLLFMKFLSKKETEQKLYAAQARVRDFGEPFARVDLADNLKTNPLVFPFVLQAINAVSLPLVDGTYDNSLNQQLNSSLESVINSRQSYGFSKDAVAGFTNSVTQTLQQYGQ